MARTAFLPEIQGMRAVAVLLVVVYHSGLGLASGGYVGVDVFFVISGYLITGLLAKEFRSTGTIDIPAFYGRRIRRLLPAAGVVLLVTVAFLTQLYSPLEIKQLSASAFSTALYFSNLWFAHLSTDYLAEDTTANPFLHTWSLSAEEQFYVFWPIFVLALARFGRRDALHGRLYPAMLVVVAASLAGALYLTQHNQPWAFFSSPTRAWEFGMGGLIALLPQPRTDRVRALLNGASVLGMGAILLSALAYDARTPFPGTAALLPTLGAAAMLAAIHCQARNPLHRLLGTSPLRVVGDISYSLYLWHWPVFVFLPMLVAEVTDLHRVAGILVATALAWLTYRLVENPFRFGLFPARQLKASSFAFGAAVSLGLASSALAARHMASSALESDEQARYLAAKQDLPVLYTAADHRGCHAQYHETEVPDCTFGPAAAARTVVLFGDSHAAQWFPALQQIAETESVRLISLTKTGCPSVLFEPFSDALARPYSECTRWRENALQRIEREQPDLVVLANSSKYPQNVAQRRQWGAGLAQAARRLSAAAEHIAIIADTPWPGFSVPTCLSRASWLERDPDDACSYSRNTFTGNPVTDIERENLAAIPNAIWIDMNPLICPGEPCRVQQQHTVLFHDAHHLTASYSRSLAAALLGRLRTAGGPLL